MFNEAELISVYSRQNAVQDGVLLSLSECFPNEVKDAGIQIPLYCTTSVYANYIELSIKARAALNDEKGRAWDLIFMSRPALKRAFYDGLAYFQFMCVRNRIQPTLCKCKVLFDGEAFTICELDED